MRANARRQGMASTRGAIYYSICPESVVLSNANMAWEVIAVIIFQGLGTGESTKVRCENRNGDDNETNAGRPVGAVKYQKTREFLRGVNCMLGKDLRGGQRGANTLRVPSPYSSTIDCAL